MEQTLITESFLSAVIKGKFAYMVMTAKHITGRQDIAEDCAMMGLMALWQNRSLFSDQKEAYAFLYTATKNFAFNELRSAATRKEYYSRLPHEESETTEQEITYNDLVKKSIEKVKAKFNKKDANIFVAHTIGLSNQEISNTFGYKYQTVRNVKNTVFKFLKLRFASVLQR